MINTQIDIVTNAYERYLLYTAHHDNDNDNTSYLSTKTVYLIVTNSSELHHFQTIV